MRLPGRPGSFSLWEKEGMRAFFLPPVSQTPRLPWTVSPSNRSVETNVVLV